LRRSFAAAYQRLAAIGRDVEGGELLWRQRHEIPERARRRMPAPAPLVIGRDTRVCKLIFRMRSIALRRAFTEVIRGGALEFEGSLVDLFASPRRSNDARNEWSNRL
jgi:hypothetical protein